MKPPMSRSRRLRSALVAGSLAAATAWTVPAVAQNQDEPPNDVQQKVDKALNALDLPEPTLAHLPRPPTIGPPITGQPYLQQPAAIADGVVSTGGGDGGGGRVSDARLKRDVVHLATVKNGIRIYTFRYLWDDRVHVGVVAQDLLADPARAEAVMMMPNGFYAVDYARLGLRMTTLAAWRKNGATALVFVSGRDSGGRGRSPKLVNRHAISLAY